MIKVRISIRGKLNIVKWMTHQGMKKRTKELRRAKRVMVSHKKYHPILSANSYSFFSAKMNEIQVVRRISVRAHVMIVYTSCFSILLTQNRARRYETIIESVPKS